jgi:hypothetical protein
LPLSKLLLLLPPLNFLISCFLFSFFSFLFFFFLFFLFFLFFCRLGCDIRLNHLSISRVHSALVHGPNNKIYLYDLGSTNGTFVDEHRIKSLVPVEIHDGNVLSFGGSTRTYTLKWHEGLRVSK